MEAMRALQRQKEAQSTGRAPACSSVCEIVDYVAENYRVDGDLDAQVRTALKRTCCQGFVKYERNDAYRLVGPFVRQLTKTQSANSTTSMSSLTARRSIRDPCEQNNTPYNRHSSGDSSNGAQDNSECDLSIPTSAAEDILWNRMQNQEDTTQRNCSAGDRVCPPDPCANNQNRNAGPSRPRNVERTQSSATENEAACKVLTPVGALEVTYSAGDDDEDAEEGEVAGRRAAEEEDDDGDSDERTEEGGGDASEESLLQELNTRCQRPKGQDRDRELKRWIRQCRRECERRAHRGECHRR